MIGASQKEQRKGQPRQHQGDHVFPAHGRNHVARNVQHVVIDRRQIIQPTDKGPRRVLDDQPPGVAIDDIAHAGQTGGQIAPGLSAQVLGYLEQGIFAFAIDGEIKTVGEGESVLVSRIDVSATQDDRQVGPVLLQSRRCFQGRHKLRGHQAEPDQVGPAVQNPRDHLRNGQAFDVRIQHFDSDAVPGAGRRRCTARRAAAAHIWACGRAGAMGNTRQPSYRFCATSCWWVTGEESL